MLALVSSISVAFLFYFLFLLSKLTNNICIITLFKFYFFVSPISLFLFIQNKDIFYSEGGWRTINDFTFNYENILFLYLECFCYLILLIFIIIFIEKLFNNFNKSYIVFIYDGKKLSFASFSYIILLLIASLFSITLYINNIAISGIPSEKLPFKLVGILSYIRLFIFPLLLILLFRFTSKSLTLHHLNITAAIIIGTTSASKAVALIYLIPLIFYFISNYKISFLNIYKFSLFLFVYQITDISRELTFVNSERQISLLFNHLIYRLYEYFEDGFFENFQMTFLGLFTRFSSFQSLILGSDYYLESPWISLFNFLFIDYLIENPSEALFKMSLPEGFNFGVGIGLLGNLLLISNSGFLITIAFLSYIAISYHIFNVLLGLINLNSSIKFFLILIFIFRTNEASIVSLNNLVIFLLCLFIIQNILKIKRSSL